ncbi:helix-turn-helix domain-containing protein [Myroides marinus]|uniref:helix-turn-helix transcriptional regulator n=1 Tax=Myroides marinus TaxID=703342 RepID=UPI002577C362|nr:helix-turn-helix domain-containing protein [Myroides marinus]MDM1350956.1 helix-turn-helix domain-containing protein [Myroides marinus]MDM1358163.1 helix-turn-helix domain-containing protein [Myroides marinus]
MKFKQQILERLDYLEQLIINKNKSILTVEELVQYTGFKKSSIYHLVHYNKIPYSKPNGKYLFFDKAEIDTWLMSNKSLSEDQIKDKAIKFALRKR